jgi:hypothetical protein
MVNFHVRKNAIFLKDPIYLLFLAPDDIPIIIPRLLPFPIYESIINCVFKGGLEFDIGAEWLIYYEGLG